MYAERNSRLLNQGPASDPIFRFSPASGRSRCDLTSMVHLRTAGRSVVTGSSSNHTFVTLGLKVIEPTSHGITLSRHDVLEASHTRRASPLLAGLSAGITSSSGNSLVITRQGISLP